MYGIRSGLNNYIGWPICGGPQQIQQTQRFVGLSGCAGGCGCGGRCHRGLGLFDSGMDFTGWALGEWVVVALGAWVLFSTVTTTRRTYRAASERIAGAYSRAAKRRRAKRQQFMRTGRGAPPL